MTGLHTAWNWTWTQIMASNCKWGQITDDWNWKKLSLLCEQEKYFQTLMHKLYCDRMLCNFWKLTEVVGDKLQWETNRIVSGVSNTSLKLQKLVQATCVAQRRPHPIQHCVNEDMSARSSGLFSLGLSLRMGPSSRPIRALNDISPWQNILVPFFRLSLCPLSLSDPHRQWYSGLDVETGVLERSYHR